jgi:uncharacterized membrane protein
MKTKLHHFLREEWLQLLLLIIPIGAALVAMPYATDRVPMQWNLHGQVNWYAPKAWGLLVMPGAMLITFTLIFWLESRDRQRHRPSDGELSSHGKATRLIRLGISLMLAAITLIQITAALGHHPDVGRWVVTLTALLFAFMGNFFGKLKPNKYVGIRIPWTLKSEHVWRQTHRLAGWVWTSSSLIVAALSWILPATTLYKELTYLWIFFLVVVPIAFAGYEAHQEKKKVSPI